MPVAESASRRWLRRLAAIAVSMAVGAVSFGALPPVTASAEPAAAVTTPDPATVTADALPTWQINGVVWSQAMVGNTVYVTGSFTKARPPGVPVGGPGEIDALNIFAYDITTGDRVPFDHSLNAQGMVVRAAPDGRRIYVGGDFTAVDGQVRQHIAAFDTATGALIPDFAPRTDGQVRAFGFAGSTLYAGGNFRSANGQARKLLAAFNTSDGEMTPWSPTVDNGYVWSMVLSPDGSRVIVGGSFTTLNTVSAYGMGALNATTGATEAWAANARLRTAGDNGAISSLNTDGTQVYGTGYSFGAGATFEGTFAADPYTGEVKWVNDCLGDTYDIFAIGQVAYNVSHRHDCSNIGLFGDTVPRNRWIKASADRTYPIGTITKKDAYGWDFTGLPYSGSLHWYPDFEFGTYTSSKQAAWTVTGTTDYVAMGGEFPKVNGVAQQGLVRFAKRPLGPRARGPINNTAFAPAPYSSESGVVHLSFSTVWDRDDATITYDIYRSPGTRIKTLTSTDSEFWNLPTLGFTDVGQTPGASVRYQVRATDSDGNVQWSAWSPYVTVSSAPPSAYATSVREQGAAHLWRLGESSGTTTAYDTIGGRQGTYTGTTLGSAGALTTESDTALTSAGGSTPKVTTSVLAPSLPAVSVEAWVKTTSTSGGRIVGFGDSATGTATTNNTDRVLYLDNSGRVNFAINDGAYRTIFSRSGLNDGSWHHVVGEVGADGMQLFVDGLRVARDQNYTAPKSYKGYWRIGADQTAGFTNRPTNAGLAGSIDEVAIYPKALSRDEIRAHVTGSGRTGGWAATPTDAYGGEVAGDSPDLFWRLGESAGNAVDAAGNGQTGNVSGTVTRNQTGPMADNAAMGFDGVSSLIVAQQPWQSPKTYSTELWFKTTSRTGGKLIGFGNTTSGLSGTTTFDRHVYMYSNGKLSFGVNNGAQTSVVSPSAYNDGRWHHVVATQGSEGMKLWVDTALVGSNAAATAQPNLGYWRVGGDRTWGSTTTNYILGTLDEVAVYPRALSEQDVRDHYSASGRAAVNRPPVAAFTSTVSHLKATFDGTGSADPDGPVTYGWDFGDSTTGTGATPTHLYAVAGTYQVTLTVGDGPGLTHSVTKPVTVVANQAPTAAFTSAATGLEVEVDGSGSTDPDGSIDGYAWDYGDGSTGAGRTDTHRYDAAGTYTVSLTVSDGDGGSAVATKVVTVTEPPNQLPHAAFSSSVADLKTTLDAGSSTDPDGTVASYAWSFGDGKTGNDPTTSHTYAEPGTYTVTLTITDNRGGTDTVSHDVTVAANQDPRAEFTVTTDDLRASVDATGSTDADGSVQSYAWSYGDGATGTGATDTHTYGAAGTYTVKLTVTDDDGATASATRSVIVTAPTVFGRDDFGRTVASGWGTADKGGSWTIPSGSSRHAVDNGVGTVTLPANASSTATLSDVSVTEAETKVSLTLDKASTGSGQYVSIIGRQVSTGNDYRAKVRVASTGAVALWMVKTVGGTETVLTSVTIPGLTYAAGDTLNFRVQAIGTNSTTFRAKVWKSPSAEPTGWTLSTSDSTAALQAPGTVGVYSYVTSSVTNGPVTYAYDKLWAGVPQ